MSILPPQSSLSQDQIDIVNALKEALALALEGKVHTFGIVLCLDEGPAVRMDGRNAGALNLGLDWLKADILEAASRKGEKTVAKAVASKIIKPRH